LPPDFISVFHSSTTTIQHSEKGKVGKVMKKFNTIFGIAAAASLTGSSLADIVSLTLTADSTASGLYSEYDSAKITITLKIDDGTSALADSVTANWSIKITKGGNILLEGAGNSSFTVSEETGSSYTVQAALDGAAPWTTMSLNHAPTLIQLSYTASIGDLLLDAISDSAGTLAGLLTVSTEAGPNNGSLAGGYTVVPAPSALVLLAGGLVLARRRRA